MCIKTTNDYTEYCTGCDLLCVLGARKSLLTNKYHATVNHKPINDTVFKTYEEACVFVDNYDGQLNYDEYLNIIFIDYDEDGDEIGFGTVC